MPVLTSTSSPARRLVGPSSSSYTSTYGSSYSRSSSTFTSSSVRTSSLDRSPYSSGYSSYKYSTLGSSSSGRDYGRPPISTRTLTSSLPYSSYSSSRASPARSYFTTRKSTSEDGAGSGTRSRETQSECRDISNNNNSSSSSGGTSYLNGNYRRTREPYTSSATSSQSKYRTSGLSNGTGSAMSVSDRVATRSKYSSEREEANSASAKLTERIRQFQSGASAARQPAETTYRSRFLRTTVEPKEEEAERPSVSDLRRRYDQNRNHVTSKPPTGKSSNQNVESDSEEPDSKSESVAKASTVPSVKVQPPAVNGKEKSASPARVVVAQKEKPARSTSPSTLSTSSAASSDNEEVKDSRGKNASSRHSSVDPDDPPAPPPLPASSEASPSPKLTVRSRTYATRSSPVRQVIRSAQQLIASDESAGLVGLKNIGNTCFMNSVLQCLSNTRALLEYVITDEYEQHLNTTTSSMNGALIKAFACVMADLWKKDEDDDDGYSTAVNPTALKSQIQKFAPRFMGYNQQDAQEFLRYLLEGMHEDVNRVTVKLKPIEQDIPDSLSDAEKALESWKRYIRRDDSKIVDLFVGQLKSTLQCTVCGHCSVTFDPFWDLSLPLPASGPRSVMANIKLHQCLELFVKEEILDGDEKPTCSKCQTRRKCTKKFTIHKFPQLLVLHLKRFSPGERFRKLEGNVDFPLADVDLSAYASPGVRPPTGAYQLYGVINHSGSAYMGHYTAYCRRPFTNTWHEYNDSKVSNISSQKIVSSEAYLLFYELETRDARL